LSKKKQHGPTQWKNSEHSQEKFKDKITIRNLILCLFFHSSLVDNLKNPSKELFGTSERNDYAGVLAKRNQLSVV